MSKNTNLSFLTDYITADITNGRIGINNASPTVAFDVVGATKITGVLTLTSTISNGTYAYTLPSATGTLALTSALSGTTNYVAKFTSSTGIGNSNIQDSGSIITLGMSQITIGTSGSQFFIYPAFSANLNLLQNYNGSAYTTEEHRASDYNFKIGTTSALTIASTGAATFSSSVTALANANSFGTAGSSGQAMFIQAGSANQAITFKNAAGGDGTLLIQGTSTSIIYRFDTYSTGNALQIANNGVITIGALGSGTVTSTSGVLSTTSDMTLKVEDGFIDNALEKISQLKPRYFYWKEESGLPTDIRQLGFYAQEVNQALGEEAANTPKNENDKWGIYDRGIIAILTKAIQELSAEITIISNKIK